MANPLLDGISKIVTEYVYQALGDMVDRMRQDLNTITRPVSPNGKWVEAIAPTPTPEAIFAERVKKENLDHPVRKCKWCKTEFFPARGNQFYHTIKCRYNANAAAGKMRKEAGQKIKKAKKEQV